MCVVIVADSQKPSLEILTQCRNANSHGIGITWLNENGKAEYKKGIELDELYQLTLKLTLPFVVHMRLASSGGKSELLCHPFEITKESQLRLEGECDKTLVHNGHIHEYERLLAAAGIYIEKNENNPMSDSRAVAMIAANNNEKFLHYLTGNFVIVDSLEKTIRMFGDFKEENGIHFSNMTWKFRGNCNYHIFERGWYDEHYNYNHEFITNGSEINSQKELKKELKKELEDITTIQEREEEFDISRVQFMTRKERKKFWKRYRNSFKVKNTNQENNDSNLPVRIHEQPLKHNNFPDNTQKFLGYPYCEDFV